MTGSRPPRAAPLLLSDAEIETALREGESYQSLSLRSGLKLGALYQRRLRLGIVTRGNRLYPLVEDAFVPPLSPDAEYWAGMLITDGCVHRGGVIKLTLGNRDRDHLAAFQAWIGGPALRPEGPIAHTWATFSRRMASGLAALGIIEGKPARVPVPSLALSPNFWRGCMDGDGWISARGVSNDALRLYGSLALLQLFQKWHGHRGALDPHKMIFHMRLEGERARDVLRRLYLCEGPALSRKRERALAILDNPRPREIRRL